MRFRRGQCRRSTGRYRFAARLMATAPSYARLSAAFRLALVPARARRSCVPCLSASGAVAFSPGPFDELRTRLDLIRRDEREAEALEERGRQRHLREGHRRGVADGPPQARVHVGADDGEDPCVEPQTVDRGALGDDLPQLDVVLLAGALLVGALGVGVEDPAPPVPLDVSDVVELAPPGRSG